MSFWVSVHLAFVSLLGLAGLHRLGLTIRTLTSPLPPAPPPLDPTGDVPFVTVQLPIYNERFVVDRLLDHVAALEYPRDRFEVQILDDSDDETTDRIRDRLPGLVRAGIRVTHLRRRDRTGYKAGALAAAGRQARGDLFLVLDADFVPEPDFLLRLVPSFEDPEVGAVQARWTFINGPHSWLTRLQALLLGGHFEIEHPARASLGAFFNFNGSGGLLRRRMVEAAGGWSADTLTEDLDLSYRMQLAGHRFVYRPDVPCPSELPYRLVEFKSQQFRWVKGSFQTAFKLGPRLATSDLPAPVRIEAALHLVTNLIYPLMAGAFLARLPMGLAPRGDVPGFLGILGPLGLVSFAVFYSAAHRRAGRPVAGLGPLIPTALMAAGGLAVNNTRAFLEACGSRQSGVFERTPKLRPDHPVPPPKYRAEIGRRFVGLTGFFELVLGASLLGAAVLAVVDSSPGAAVFSVLFGTGLVLSGAASVRDVRLFGPAAGADTLEESPGRDEPVAAA